VGASAAYWIASAADRIVVSPTSLLGSIGVVMTHLDTRQRDAKAGVEQIDIVSSGSPFKRDDVRTDDGRARVQVLVDQLCDVFVASVARNRSTSSSKVLERYGRGGLLVGGAALKAGMADSLGSLEDVIADRSTKSRPAPHASASAEPQSLLAVTPEAGPRCASFAEISARRRGAVTGEAAVDATEGLSFSAGIFARRRAGTLQDPGAARGVQLKTVPTAQQTGTAVEPTDRGNSLSPSTIFARRTVAVAAAAAGDSAATPDPSPGAGGLPSAASLFERRKRETKGTS
jgi:ClpP class serine protease